MNEELLIRLFHRHFADPVAALKRLDAHLASIELPFDLKVQLRELPFPPQPGLPGGLPSFIYYFVPNLHRGSDQKIPKDPLHHSFVNACDGIGLNLGCPVRLLRALDALALLSAKDQMETRNELCIATQHLAAVEELLWLTCWKAPSSLRRGEQFTRMSGDVDWALDTCGYPIFVEAKFRRSDWPRITDGSNFVLMGEGFLSKATHKFPEPPQTPALHIVGVTTFANITDAIVPLVSLELKAAPQIHAVVFRSLLQMTYVLSLSAEVCGRVLGMLTVPSISDYPVNYVLLPHREQRDQRVAQRTMANDSGNASEVFVESLCPRGLVPLPPPEDIYRLEIPSHGPDGEPHFCVIPRFLMPSHA